MRRFLLSMLSVAAAATMVANDGVAGGESFVDVPGEHLDLLVDGKARLRYMYAFDTSSKESRMDTYKVYYHVLAEDGESLITKGPGGKFPHHRGIFLGWNGVGFNGKKYDLWHMHNGNIVHEGIVYCKRDGKSNALQTLINWQADDETIILNERRTASIRLDDPEAYLTTDFTCELTAPDGDVTLNQDPEHAGFQYRPHNDVVSNASATYVYHEDGVNVGKARDLPWVAMTYKLGDDVWTVQHMNHPDNPKKTRHSAYRNYGRFGAVPSGKIEAGETLTLKYRIRITKGAAPDREVLAEKYAEYLEGR